MRLLTAVLVLTVLVESATAVGLPEAKPADLGFDPVSLDRVDAAVNRAISAKKLPGAVVLVGRRGKIALARAYGQRKGGDSVADQPMTRDTIFDLASLTKPLATASSILVLVDQGKLRLDDRLGTLLPEFDNRGKGEITVDQLLRHRSGLIADNPLADYADGPQTAWERLSRIGLASMPGERFVYSDVGYIILGRIVERVSGKPLNEFASDNLFWALKLFDTKFRRFTWQEVVAPGATYLWLGGFPLPILVQRRYRRPIDEVADPRIAMTDGRPDCPSLRGVVHDPRARALGGIAGHTGLFGTADDLAVLAQMFLEGGRALDGRRILRPETVNSMISPGDTPPKQRRGLGWDIDTPYSAPRGRIFGPTSYGHTGFTGTSVWIDPQTKTFVIVLTCRVYPGSNAPSPTALRSEISTIVGESIRD
ncbi:MAG: hypothetical protein JWN86_2801 [Planctomycetota bacterium]|nr:hypothetical protein [Planctomycetota bacterium]